MVNDFSAVEEWGLRERVAPPTLPADRASANSRYDPFISYRYRYDFLFRIPVNSPPETQLGFSVFARYLVAVGFLSDLPTVWCMVTIIVTHDSLSVRAQRSTRRARHPPQDAARSATS